MKTISIINLKGGVAKTLTTISMAHILSERHGKRVLVVDNDKQGNTSKTCLMCFSTFVSICKRRRPLYRQIVPAFTV